MPVPLPAIVKRLAATPPEIVCEILNDLRIWDVLRLICYNDSSINNAVLLNRWYGRILENKIELLLEMRELAQMYWDFAREMRWKLAPLNSPLALQTGTSLDGKGHNDMHIIRVYMWLKPAMHLHDLSGRRFELLPLYCDRRIPGTAGQNPDDLRNRWYALRTAQNNLMEHRARQLTRAADLLESNPDILKLASDPGQQRRENIAHIIDGMKRTIQRMSRNSMIRGDGNPGANYFFVYFPVVPFDASLRFVLKQLKNRHEGRRSDSRKNDDSLKVLLAGISSIYTTHGRWTWTEDTTQPWRRRKDIALTYPEQIPRVMYKDQPYNARQNPYTSDLDLDQLKFVSGYTKFYRFLPHAQNQKHRWNREASWDKHDDREIEWLEAFVKVYRSLQGEESV